jgi:ribosomal protein S18 acetylase RimI-like enzyme
MCTCRFLTEDDFPEVARTFNEAFSDYYLKMNQSSEVWLRNRMIKNGVALDHSVAAFADGRMVGFTLIGLDGWMGESAAFDAATGIIPDYRGKGLARKIFEASLPKLKEGGVRKFLLEVLQVNEPAIKVYRKTGFEITREFDCYDLKPDNVPSPRDHASDLRIESIGRERLVEFEPHLDWQPSWENSFESIRRIPDEVVAFGAFVDGKCVGEIIYYPLIRWLVSLVVKPEYRRRGLATALLEHLVQQLEPGWPHVKLTNVLSTDKATSRCLANYGFTIFTRQYEMALDLLTQ